MSELLVQLQIYKNTANGNGAGVLFAELRQPLPGWSKEIRDFVIEKQVCLGYILAQHFVESRRSKERSAFNLIHVSPTIKWNCENIRSHIKAVFRVS